MVLEELPVELVTASSGAEALQRALAFRPHIVILDLGLPDMDGYAVLEHLREVNDLSSTRFIALSGRSMPEDQDRMRAAGFHHQMVKPADVRQLLELVRSCGIQE